MKRCFYDILEDQLKGKEITVTWGDYGEKQHSATGLVSSIGQCDNGRLDVNFEDSSKSIFNMHLNDRVEIK